MSLKEKILATKDYPSLVISSAALRKCIGIMGMLFPIMLIAGSMTRGGCTEIQNSISNYYYTNMRDLYVGSICLVGMLLFSYKGYDRTDKAASMLAGSFALGIAFFPTSVRPPLTSCIGSIIDQNVVGTLHLISAALFFITLSWLSFFRFTKGRIISTTNKIKRNKVYRICAYVMIATIILIACYMALLKHTFPTLQAYQPIFWLECMGLMAFGISWLTKGGAWLKDRKKHPIFLILEEAKNLFKTS